VHFVEHDAAAVGAKAAVAEEPQTWLSKIFSTTSGTAPTWWSRPQPQAGLDSGGQLDLVLHTEGRRCTGWHGERSPSGRPASGAGADAIAAIIDWVRQGQ